RVGSRGGDGSGVQRRLWGEGFAAGAARDAARDSRDEHRSDSRTRASGRREGLSGIDRCRPRRIRIHGEGFLRRRLASHSRMVQRPATVNPERLAEGRDATRKSTAAKTASTLARCALAGSAAALLLAAVEIVDLEVHLSHEFNSSLERLIFAAYFSLCPL